MNLLGSLEEFPKRWKEQRHGKCKFANTSTAFAVTCIMLRHAASPQAFPLDLVISSPFAALLVHRFFQSLLSEGDAEHWCRRGHCETDSGSNPQLEELAYMAGLCTEGYSCGLSEES